MKKAFSSKIFVPIYQWTKQYNWEDFKFNTNHCENLKSQTGHLKQKSYGNTLQICLNIYTHTCWIYLI